MLKRGIEDVDLMFAFFHCLFGEQPAATLMFD